MAKKNKPTKLRAIDGGRGFLHKITSGDGWRNPLTGMGIVGRDKGESTGYSPDEPLDQLTLDEVVRGDGIAMSIVERVVNDALRSGWELTFKGGEDEQVTAEQAKEYNERIARWHKKVKLTRHLSQHLSQARQYGGSLLVLGAGDGQSPDEELDLERVSQFTWLRAHDRYQVSQSSEVNDDPGSPGFGFPEWYRLHSSNASVASASDNRNEAMLDVEVHNSRVWRSDGVILSDRVRLRNEGWGDSVLQACHEPLSAWGSVMKASKTIVQDWMQGVYKIKNLQGIILANGDEEVRKRFHLMDIIKSAWKAIMVDADNEDYVRQTTSVAGLADLLSWFGAHTAAVARMPMTLLFGVSPGGFGTGEAEGDNWDDSVKAFQTDYVEPALEYIYGILFQTDEFSDLPEDWAISFTSLQLTDPMQEADIRLKTSQADATDISSGVLSSDEVAMSRYGGAAYSTQTHLDEEAREMDARVAEEMEEAGIAGPESEPVDSGSMGTVLDIIERVTTGKLPKESARPLILAMLPNVDVSMVDEILGPIEFQEPEPEAPEAPDGPEEPEDSEPDDPESEESDEEESDPAPPEDDEESAELEDNSPNPGADDTDPDAEPDDEDE